MSFAWGPIVEDTQRPTGQKEPAAADGVALMGQDTGSGNTTGSEKEIGMTTENANPRHLARPVQRLYTTTRRQAQKGLNAENSRPATARGGDISLDIPFYRAQGSQRSSVTAIVRRESKRCRGRWRC